MGAKDVGKAPIFICGVGRSGTSLVQSMFAAHSCLSFPPETSFLRRLVVSGALTQALSLGGEERCLQLLKDDPWLARIEVDAQEILARVRLSEERVTGGGLYRALLGLYADRYGVPRCGDKDPRAIECLGIVARVLPNVHVIHVIRDPRDVLSSKKKAAWSRKRGALFHIFANYVQMQIGRNQGPKILRERYHEIVYEELISDPENVLREMCQKTGLTFEPGMLEFADTANRLVSESEMSWKKETLGPILNQNAGKWKQGLCVWEVALTEIVCVEALKVGGYEKSGSINKLSLAKRLVVRMLALSMKVAAYFYRLYRCWIDFRSKARSYV